LPRAAYADQETIMKKTIMTLALAITAITGLGLAASTSTPSKDGNDLKSRIYYFVHYRTFYYTPVYYRPVVVAPIYPVYTYHYWYYKFAGR
jgi:hypothetical protein